MKKTNVFPNTFFKIILYIFASLVSKQTVKLFLQPRFVDRLKMLRWTLILQVKFYCRPQQDTAEISQG